VQETLIAYKDFRTGLTYSEVYYMLWVCSEDSTTWRYKRRGTVLGFWRMLKQQMYAQYVEEYEAYVEKKNTVPF